MSEITITRDGRLLATASEVGFRLLRDLLPIQPTGPVVPDPGPYKMRYRKSPVVGYANLSGGSVGDLIARPFEIHLATSKGSVDITAEQAAATPWHQFAYFSPRNIDWDTIVWTLVPEGLVPKDSPDELRSIPYNPATEGIYMIQFDARRLEPDIFTYQL